PVRTPDGEIYDPRDLFPAGFTPRFFGEITDYSFTGGISGESDNDLSWDFGGRYGRSEMEYQNNNTMNPSMGPSTPTNFRPGDLVSDEAALTADFTLPLRLEFADVTQLAFGFEYKEEGYKSGLGDPASFEVGPYSFDDPWDFETSEAEAAAGENGGVIECRIPGLESIGEPCPAQDPIHNVLNIGSEGFPGYSPL
ncbi:MAG: TonB-dependent receptor, partial [Desulfuromonadales bacterium]|nr:TonB-dependent receptor [Desulfuromonadales bacterium]